MKTLATIIGWLIAIPIIFGILWAIGLLVVFCWPAILGLFIVLWVVSCLAD